MLACWAITTSFFCIDLGMACYVSLLLRLALLKPFLKQPMGRRLKCDVLEERRFDACIGLGRVIRFGGLLDALQRGDRTGVPSRRFNASCEGLRSRKGVTSLHVMRMAGERGGLVWLVCNKEWRFWSAGVLGVSLGRGLDSYTNHNDFMLDG